MNDGLIELLDGVKAPGIYRLSSRPGWSVIGAEADRRGWRSFHLDGRQIATKDDFLRACARVMRFPAYFGSNWDALEECLRDLAWAPAEAGYLVMYERAAVFAASQPQEFAIALDILQSTVESWRHTSTPMAILLRGMGRIATAIPRL